MPYQISNLKFQILIVPLWVMAVALEGIACILFIEGLSTQPFNESTLLVPFALHLCASIPIFCVPFLLPEGKRRDIKFYSCLSGCLTLFLPAIGIIGVLFALLWANWIMRSRGVVEDYQEVTDYSLERKPVADILRNLEILLADETNIEPILDILDSEDEDLKRGAVDLLGRIGNPSAVRLLKKCLAENNPEVRLYAHSTLEKLNEDYADEIREIQGLAGSEKTEDGNHLKQLGQKYREYAESGLLENETKTHYLELAKEIYLDLLGHSPDDNEIPITLGELSLSMGQFAEAESYFKKALKTGSDPVDPLLGLCRVYYEKGNSKSLSEVARSIGRIKNQKSGDVQKDILLQFWGNPQEV